ncbi:MAG: shikimate kinase [Clostridia bacterium]|nr:shikimate kinase [Clostridia bacterium]
MNFVLIGMPGSGKSCMGRALARKLKIKNIDTDRVIEERVGKALQTLIDEVGVDRFRELEEETLLSIEAENSILSTGGSAVYSKRAMEKFHSEATVIYLKCSYRTIEKRIGDFSKRGVVLRPGQTLRDLYDERVPLYEKYAHVTVNCDGEAYSRYIADAVRKIKELM